LPLFCFYLLLLSNSDLRNAGRVRSIRLAVTLGSGQAAAASRRRKAVAGWPQASPAGRRPANLGAERLVTVIIYLSWQFRQLIGFLFQSVAS